MKKRIVFLSGTRADFGKMKSLIQVIHDADDFDYNIFATGMHLLEKYGLTVIEIEKCGFKNIHRYSNYTSETTMDLTLARTIEGFSAFVKQEKPDLIIVHGDRSEALAGAIVGSLNNILVGHIEGGEVSGTVDELIRHAVSKLSHIHFVSNDIAANRLVQLGELEESIFTIGSPDLDILFSKTLPKLSVSKAYYEIPFDKYALLLFHPVTTEIDEMELYAEYLVQAVLDDDHNYIVVFPNNDMGSSAILKAYEKLRGNKRFRIFPSLRFEHFITLLENAQFLLGNSSAGIHEAPYLGVPTINIGRRQENRDIDNTEIINVENYTENILGGIARVKMINSVPKKPIVSGNSANQFLKTLRSKALWDLDHQKQFKDL
tara:strand:+ start:5311 stop:6435 length:1125 start_codon:yes stop_codon:yes gene_type:complete